jgi:CDP-6-deoxy-D-xylo-4-hexulose-3-dehydrase
MRASEIIKHEIFEKVKEYYKAEQLEKKPSNKINYAGRVYDEKELINLVDASLEFWLTSGRFTKEFEKKLADFLNLKYCLFVNSGSSANLLAFMALTSPLLKERKINRGDEVLTTACVFPTTISPIVQYGAVPVFVDVDFGGNINSDLLERALTSKTKAVMTAHTLGYPFDIDKVKEFCNKNNLWLIEDNCDALGSKYKNQYTGTFGDIGTSSFFPAHHITTGEGGATYTNNPLLYKIMKSMRDWGRDYKCDNCVPDCNKRYSYEDDQLKNYDCRYTYASFGYNLKATDLQASIGVIQLDKLLKFKKARQNNWEKIYRGLSDFPFRRHDYYDPNWFGYLFIIPNEVGFSRNDIVEYLENHNIQTRNLFAGNITKHSCFDSLELNKDYKICGELTNTNILMNQAFWIGVYPRLDDNQIDYVIETFKNFLNLRKKC